MAGRLTPFVSDRSIIVIQSAFSILIKREMVVLIIIIVTSTERFPGQAPGTIRMSADEKRVKILEIFHDTVIIL